MSFCSKNHIASRYSMEHKKIGEKSLVQKYDFWHIVVSQYSDEVRLASIFLPFKASPGASVTFTMSKEARIFTGTIDRIIAKKRLMYLVKVK